MEKKSFKCIICERTLKYSEHTGSPPITMKLKLKDYNIIENIKNAYLINRKFKVCISCYNQSFFHVNKKILEHVKKLIEKEIKGN